MDRSTAELIEHRSIALAKVSLSRRDDLFVKDMPENGEMDLLVRITSPGSSQVRFLGVITIGDLQPIGEEEASRLLSTFFRLLTKRRGAVKHPFPVMALIFSMYNEKGFYAWRSKPLLGDENKPALELQQSMRCKRFTKSALDEVISLTTEWYDSLFSFLTPR